MFLLITNTDQVALIAKNFTFPNKKLWVFFTFSTKTVSS